MSTQELRYDWTYADYARLPDDGNHYEVLDGELLVTPSPSPWHQRVAARLLLALDPYVERNGVGVVIPDVDLSSRAAKTPSLTHPLSRVLFSPRRRGPTARRLASSTG